MTSPQHLTARLLRALDTDYNVVDMRAINEVISVLENINITKELLETTRLGKHVNELRRRTDDVALARRSKLLLKRWRDLVIPDKAGSKPPTPKPPTSAESTPRQSPYASRGISPAVTPSVTPRLCSPAVPEQNLNIFHKQGSLTPSLSDGAKHFQQYQKRQPLTSPALRNLSPGLRNSAAAAALRNSSPNFKNVISGQNSPAAFRNISSPAVRNISPVVRGVPVISPALRMNSDTVWNVTPSKDPYDSDSQDVIFVDDNVDDNKTTFGSNSNSLSNFSHIEKSSVSKRPRSPINGGPDTSLPSDELRNDAKRKRRESSSRKAKKRRNHTKSENRTVDHSQDVSLGSPFLPISSASTSPALSISSSMRNGMAISSIPPVVLLIDDVDSKSPVPTLDSKSKLLSSSRRNGCKKPPTDDYSNFIKSKIPAGGRKVKTTKELLEEMDARKSGKILAQPVEEKKKPREDFLTTYDNQKQLKKDSVVVSDIIELNDSNSSSKLMDSAQPSPALGKDDDKSVSKSDADIKTDLDEKPVKFEPVDVILSRLPPIETSNLNDKEDMFAPQCTCTMIYYDNEEKEGESSPIPKKSIFELDEYEEPSAQKEKGEAETDSANLNYEEKLDPDCHASLVYKKRPEEVANYQIDALHNCHLTDVNGSVRPNDVPAKKPDLACRVTEWGLRPYYDCSRDLFQNVVPKYNYLDYSLDKCVKNTGKIVLDKYEPAEIAGDPEEWYLELENQHFEKWKVKNESLICDDFESAADLPFSESAEDDPCSTDDVAEDPHFDSDIKNSDSDKSIVNLDRKPDLKIKSSAVDSKKEGSTLKDSSKADAKSKKTNKINCFEILDYMVEAQCRPFQTTYSKCIFLDNVNFSSELDRPKTPQPAVEEVVEVAASPPKEISYPVYVPRSSRKFTYEDDITLLPLSLAALNSHISYDDSRRCIDLSCVFRTKAEQEDDELTYGLVNNAKVLNMKDVSSSVISRTRDLFLGDQNEDANFDGDMKKADGDPADKTNSGAFANDRSESAAETTCVGSGCPSWLPGSEPPDSFREWHEPVVRTSYNEEPLTVLPYVVID